MYINAKELNALEMAVNKLQDIIESQAIGQNNYFIEGTHEARERANLCEKYIDNIREREVRSKAIKIIRERNKQ